MFNNLGIFCVQMQPKVGWYKMLLIITKKQNSQSYFALTRRQLQC